ncbi:MAG: YDG domain-containing protein, partial [Verrucomicrobiota bacterium]
MPARLRAEVLTVVSSSANSVSANGEVTFTQTAQLPAGAVVDKVTLALEYSTSSTSTATATDEVVLNGVTLNDLNWVSNGTGNTWVSVARQYVGLPGSYSTSGGNTWKIRSLYNPVSLRNLAIQIHFRRTLTVSGLSAVSREYNGTAVATITGTPSLQGVVAGDSVSLSGTATGTFANESVGTAKSVTVAGLTLTGTSAARYVLVQPTLTANIMAKPLSVGSSTVTTTKVYDRTTTAAVP